eukprot:11570012-Alexandrium_andersonii.AAC.1
MVVEVHRGSWGGLRAWRLRSSEPLQPTLLLRRTLWNAVPGEAPGEPWRGPWRKLATATTTAKAMAAAMRRR